MFEEDKKNLVRNDKRGLPQIRNYQLIKKIGQGIYGKIYLAEDTKNLNLVALKIIDKTFLEILGKSEEAFIEQYMLIHLKHNNIMNLKITCEQELKREEDSFKDKILDFIVIGFNNSVKAFINEK